MLAMGGWRGWRLGCGAFEMQARVTFRARVP